MEGIGAQALWAGIALSSAGLTFAIFAPVWGLLADRYGRKPMVCRAMFGGALVIFLMSFARTMPQLVMLRMCQGVLSGSLTASIVLVASVVPQKHSGLTLGMMQAAVFIGIAVGPFFGGMAADAFGYRTSFQVGALLILMGGLLVYLGIRENFTPTHASVSADSPGFMNIFLLSGFLISVVVMFSVRFSNSMASPSFPLIMKDIIGTTKNLNSITGAVIASAAVAGAISAAILGHVGDRIGRRRILIGCCIGACVASVGHFFAQDLPTLFAMRILFGFSVAGMLPAANAMIHAVIDQRSIGKAYGLATSLSMLGAAIGPAVGGYIAMKAGLRVPFLITGAAQISLAILILLFFHERRADMGMAKASKINRHPQ